MADQHISLQELFSTEELGYLDQVWEKTGRDMLAFMDALKPWFKDPERIARLAAKGFAEPKPGKDSYASYWVPYHYAQLRQAVQAQQQGAESDDIVDRIMGNRPPPGDPSLN